MTASTRLGLATLGIALPLGCAGDLLLRDVSWGINLTAWTVLLIVGFWALRRVQTAALPSVERWLLAGLLASAACFAWRDSPTLRALNGLCVLAFLSLLAGRAQPVPLFLSSVGRLLRGFLAVPLQSLAGTATLLFRDVVWSTVPRTRWSRHGVAVARGVALAFPLLIVFGGLLAAADAVFSHFIGAAFRWDPTDLLGHAATVIACAWLSAGLLRTWLTAPADPQAGPPPSGPTLGATETATVLGLLNLLFLSFVVIQVRYFFGGAALVQNTVGLSYAQYARQGFFELVAVAALVLPVLLGLHGLQRADDGGRARSVFRLLAGLQVCLLFVIMTSAVARMGLYQNEYGLSELRLYTSAFMGWLAVVFLWFAATVLRGARPRFAFGALLSAFAAVFLLNAANPDAAIVRANAARVRAGHPFDTAYAAGLSADAAPALVAALPRLASADQAVVIRDLQREQQRLRRDDWRSWSVSHQLARQARWTPTGGVIASGEKGAGAAPASAQGPFLDKHTREWYTSRTTISEGQRPEGRP